MSNTRKARYDGGSGTGVDVLVTLADGQQRYVHVEQGHQLPTEVGGVDVPAKARDALTATDDWTEVDVNTDPPKPAKDDKITSDTTAKDKAK